MEGYEKIPYALQDYIAWYGKHFNKKLFEHAVNNLKSRSGKHTLVPKASVDEIMKKNLVNVERGKGYDTAFVFNMLKSDYYGTAIVDDRHLCLAVKDYIDDVDAPDGVAFVRWLATVKAKEETPDFEEFL